ncbi:MAG: hypothetical protein HFE90_06840 [Firmicutes bacterium]|nr:hypothetical protein [Bacillota bacterium]
MKSAKIFLILMYVHLALSVAVPIALIVILSVSAETLFGQSKANVSGWLLMFYFVCIFIVLAAGWVSVGCAVYEYNRGRYEKVRDGWKKLKLWSIPFYMMNFCYSVFAWFLLVGGSRGIAFIFIPIPIAITCTMIFQSGCAGWCYIRYLNRRSENSVRVSGGHYLLQVIPVLDIISTVFLLKQENQTSVERTE